MNNISKSKTSTQESYPVPADVMPEIAQIILQAGLPHEIIGVKENKRQIIIGISYQSNLKYHQDAIKNIVGILRDYDELCYGESDTVNNWRDSQVNR